MFFWCCWFESCCALKVFEKKVFLGLSLFLFFIYYFFFVSGRRRRSLTQLSFWVFMHDILLVDIEKKGKMVICVFGIC